MGTAVYLNSFEGGFVFDDLLYLNANLHTLRQAMFAPDNVARPLIGFTLGLNYAISGFDDWSYHLLNMLVHIFAALYLYGIVRRTLLGERLREAFGERASVLALVVALIWMVHPLQTQSVTYIIQRCESIMGLFYLMTLYCAMRSFTGGKKGLWTAGAILACAAGMLSKQVMATAPLMVLLYDWFFVSSSLKEVWQRHRGLHIGLASTWCLIVLTLVAVPAVETAGFAVKAISPVEYYLSQFRVMAQYVRVALYPDGLSADYGWKKANGMGGILPFAIPILVLQAATVWGIYRRKPLAFLGAWFFGILAVTSSFMPIADLIFEHRMYLPLAAVVMVVVLVGDKIARRLSRPEIGYMQDGGSVVRKVALALVVFLVLTLGALTMRRNIDYRSQFTFWTDAVNKQPQSPRAHINLGKQFEQQGLLEEAAAHYTEAVTHDPDNLIGQNNLGLALTNLGRAAEAREHLLYAVSLRPNFYLSHQNLGHALVDLDEFDQAIEHLTTSIELNPKEAESHYYLGLAYQKAGRCEDALASLDHTFELDPKYTDAVSAKALLYLTAKDPKFKSVAQAIRWAEWAVQLTRRRYGKPLDVLAQCYAEAGRYQEAVAAATDATNSLYARLHKDFAAASAARLAQYRAALSLAKANRRASTPS